jgi:hypothetical protein
VCADWKKNYVEEDRPVGPDGLPAWTVITKEQQKKKDDQDKKDAQEKKVNFENLLHLMFDLFYTNFLCILIISNNPFQASLLQSKHT